MASIQKLLVAYDSIQKLLVAYGSGHGTVAVLLPGFAICW